MQIADIPGPETGNASEAMIVPPGTWLAETVRSFWHVCRFNSVYQREIIVPKGVVEMIFNFSDENDYYSLQSTAFQPLPRCSVSGYFTRPISLLLSRQQSCFGIVLNTTALRRLLGVPAGELLNTTQDITLIDTTILSLWHKLAEQETFGKRVHVFTEWMQSRIQPLQARDVAMNNFLNGNSPDPGSVEELSRTLCYSSRQLSRKLIELTGMNAGETLRYTRYLKSLYHMHTRHLTGSEIAHASNFFDQAHFSRVFKSYASFSPSEYKALQGPITGHILM